MLEKTVQGVRSIVPGLYRDGDPRGPAWEGLLERELGSLVADPDGINAVDAKELNRRLFVVAQRLADDVMSLHLRALLDRGARMGLKRRLQSMYAVGMVAFLELPYYIAWSFQSRDRTLAGGAARLLPRRAPAHAARAGGRALRERASCAARAAARDQRG